MIINKNLCIFFVSFFLNVSNSLASENIAFIDIDYIFNNSSKGKEIISKLNKINNENLKLIKINEDDIIKLNESIKSKKNVLNTDELNTQVATLNDKINNLNNLKKEISNRYEIQRKDEIKIFFNAITPYIQEYMTSKSINIIIDKKNIFLANQNYDITLDLLKIINEKYK